MKRLLILLMSATAMLPASSSPGGPDGERAGGVVLLVRVADRTSSDPLAGARVSIDMPPLSAATDAEGICRLQTGRASVTVTVETEGYRLWSKSLKLVSDTLIDVGMEPRSMTLGEVVVTAKEKSSVSSTTRIDRSAMEHLQPTSFTDLLELLPGNVSRNPDMSSVNSITLRETGTLNASGNRYSSSDYAITSLGTLFMVDGAPLNTDAGMQSEGLTVSDSSSPAAGALTTNKGVDMRTIGTDNVESVEIVRGIPSAEYGNLTSGLVNIKRIRRTTPLTMRFKADSHSLLLSAGKGVGFYGDRHILNFDIGYLSSSSDPRILTDGYTRVTASARANMKFYSAMGTTVWNYGLDYTAGIDRSRIDPDLNYRRIDEFRSSYGRVAFNSNLTMTFNPGAGIDVLHMSVSASFERERLRRLKEVSLSRATVAPLSMEPGESIGEYLPANYVASYLSDGRPFSMFVKMLAKGNVATGIVRHNLKGGGEWTMAKNFGRGQVYDLSRPLSGSWTSRPRAYRDVPAVNVLSFFAEDNMVLSAGDSELELQAGLRSIQLPGISKDYYLSGKVYLDPRLNIVWRLPEINAAGKSLKFYLGAGYGVTTRMPTADYLYPQCSYADFLQLNYFDATDQSRSLVSLMTYVNDATNYSLRPSRNRKLEIRLGMEWGPFTLQASMFSERMTDGFRYSAAYAPYSYKKYDSSVISPGSTPQIEAIPYEKTVVLSGYRYASNGTRIDKQGVEFTISTVRWQPVHTALTINGAWLKTRYSNSQDLFSPVSDVVDGVPVSDRYVGLYHTADGRINEQFNTNFMFDTQLQRPSLIVTTSFQFMWYVMTRRLPENGTPDFYLATDGMLHPYDDDARQDPVLGFLEEHYSDALYRPQRIPLAMYINLKVTKPIGKHVRVALFVNRIMDYLPDYKSNGLTIRRSSSSYFGMELNLSF